MERKLSCELKCLHCSEWFRSPLQFGYPEAFFDMAKEITTTNCPLCGNRTIYRKDQMRFLTRNRDGSLNVVDGKFVMP